MRMGGRWVGLPYLLGGVILVGAAVLVGVIKGTYVDVKEGGGEDEALLGSGVHGQEGEVGGEEARV
jgi:hypothetical protein